jgi:hypothetical protein
MEELTMAKVERYVTYRWVMDIFGSPILKKRESLPRY